jgi:hypothetical protein
MPTAQRYGALVTILWVIVGFGELSSSVRVLLDGCPSVEQEPSQQVAARPDEEDGSESSMQCDEHGEARA